MYCPLCGETTREIDSQQHLLTCEKLNIGKPQEDASQYDFIFSFNLEKMKELVIIFERALYIRESLLDSYPSQSKSRNRKKNEK